MTRRGNLDREQLRRFGLYKMRLQRENGNRPVNERVSSEHIRRTAREAVKMGKIGTTGEAIPCLEDSDPQTTK